MSTVPRRLTFQLVSLFDLLMIVIFAQYLDVQEKTRNQLARAAREVAAAESKADQAEEQKQAETEILASGEEIRRLLERGLQEKEEQYAALKADLEQQLTERDDELDANRARMERLSALVAELFHLSPESLAGVLKSRSAEETARITEQLKRLASGSGGEAVKHLLTLAELEKRCDVWEIRIGDDNVALVSAGERKQRIRPQTPQQFQAELFKFYQQLPQPKSLVVILLSWADAELGARNAAQGGIELATEHMRTDSERRSRFEYAVLGYIP